MKTSTPPRIAFDDVGDGEPALLFLPGWCAPRDVFRPLWPHLSRRALAPDWRGHGGSDPAPADFGHRELVEDALSVIEASGARRVIPVALSHAGWVAIALAERLGPERVPGVGLISWMVLGPPPPFTDGLRGLQQPGSWEAVRGQLFSMWASGVEAPAVHRYIEEMGRFGFEMWSRAAREIAAAFHASPVPLERLAALGRPTLHLYAQPDDPGFLEAQKRYAASHPWFEVIRLEAASHFPMLEAPEPIAAALERFADRAS